MYTKLSEEEEARFLNEIDIIIKKYGEKIVGVENIIFFRVLTQDKLQKTLCFDVLRGEAALYGDNMVIRSIVPIENSVIKESKGLHKVICEESIKKFINKARLDSRKKLVVYTHDDIIIETLTKLKFDIDKLSTLAKDEVRAELGI